MAKVVKKGQHIFIPFQGEESVVDSQLRPRMYKSREQFERWFPAWRDGKAELVEYAPVLTQPNEPLTMEELRKMNGQPVWVDDEEVWALLQVWENDEIEVVFPMPIGCFHAQSVIGRKIYRRPPEGSDDA